MKTYRLYLGRNIGTDSTVSDEAFDAFLGDTVAPLFDGFTITQAQGFWKGTRENTTIIEILTDNEAGIGIIARVYASRFSQDAVLVQQVTGVSEFVTVA
jgi:hypothetical protein